MSRSKARMFPGPPVLVAREMCENCQGEGSVPTPEMAGWVAAVERSRRNTEAELGVAAPHGKDAYDRAREAVGPAPEQTSERCKGCGGEGFKETELYLDELRAHLAKESE